MSLIFMYLRLAPCSLRPAITLTLRFLNETTNYDDGVIVNSPGRIYAGRERPSDRVGNR